MSSLSWRKVKGYSAQREHGTRHEISNLIHYDIITLYYKVRQKFINKMRQVFYYKMRRLLQIATVHTYSVTLYNISVDIFLLNLY